MSATHTERPQRRSLAPLPAPPARSFKLRFASQSATVTDKFYRREIEDPLEEPVQLVCDMFQLGPRDKFPAPFISSQEYGWWAESASGMRSGSHAARLDYHIRDSAWLKERVRVLAPDAGYKR